MTKLKLEELKATCEKKKKEFKKALDEYVSAKIEQDYGKYINKFTICHLSDDHFPIGDNYVFIKSISYSPKLARHIIIQGIGFEKRACNVTRSLRFSFDPNCHIDTFDEDVEIEIISEQEWRNKYSECVSELNKNVDTLKFI